MGVGVGVWVGWKMILKNKTKKLEDYVDEKIMSSVFKISE